MGSQSSLLDNWISISNTYVIDLPPRYTVNEILLKVALNTITPNPYIVHALFVFFLTGYLVVQYDSVHTVSVRWL
jgi:hypothetical protein